MITKHIPSDVWNTKNAIFRLTQQKAGTTPDLFAYTRKISIYYTESPVFCQLKIYLSYAFAKRLFVDIYNCQQTKMLIDRKKGTPK